MGISFRLLLFAGAVCTMAYFIFQIRKSRLQIEYAIFWALLSAGLVVLGIFPGIIIWAARLLSIESPANLLFALIFLVLIIKLFTTTVKQSKMDRQIADMAQYIAILEAEKATQENPLAVPSDKEIPI